MSKVICSKITVKELKNHSYYKHIDGRSKMNKAELCKAINNAIKSTKTKKISKTKVSKVSKVHTSKNREDIKQLKKMLKKLEEKKEKLKSERKSMMHKDQQKIKEIKKLLKQYSKKKSVTTDNLTKKLQIAEKVTIRQSPLKLPPRQIRKSKMKSLSPIPKTKLRDLYEQYYTKSCGEHDKDCPVRNKVGVLNCRWCNV